MNIENDNYSEMKITKPQIEFPGEETRMNYAVPSLDQPEDRNLLNDQVFILFYFL